ncbi:MAG: DHA2 family efflux MFS transporter permease subunit [Hyphomonadaceae bacterium]|nr:DHA2 family efflux MFS transporter permease subunit [Hyphomonadaceae bacterium]
MTLVLASIAIALGTFMQVLDSTIANVSIPTIAGDLGVSFNQGAWVITSFAVSNGISVPLTGWLVQRFGVVRTFVTSVLLFTLMSLLCGLAWNIESLVIFRVLQGAVSGPMIPGSQALLIMIFGRQRQASALAIWSMTALVAPVAGPILGGYISDNIAWEWIFLINVPVGLACAFICWAMLRDRETPSVKLPIDVIGFALLVVWVGVFQVMLDTGHDADWFNSPWIVIALIISVIGFIAWVIWETHEKHPIVDLSLFKSRNFSIGVIAICTAYAVFFANTLLLPLWLQTEMGYTAFWAGLISAPTGLIAIMLTPFVARLIGTVDARWIATATLAVFGVSFMMRAFYAPDGDFAEFVLPMLIQGIGMSGFFISLTSIAFAEVSGPQIAAASGLSNFARIVSGAFSASVVTTIWERGAAEHQTRVAEVTGRPGSANWEAAMQELQRHGASAQEAFATLVAEVSHQATFLAALDIFRISAFMTGFLVLLVWLTRRPKPQADAAHAVGE